MNPILLFVLIILISAGGSFVQRVSGFGMGIFVMLFFPHLMPTYTVGVAVSGLMSMMGSWINAVRHLKQVQFRILLPLLCSAMVAIPVAVLFLSGGPEERMKLLLGIVLILLSIYFLFFSKRIRIRPTVGNGIVAGALGGTLSGLFSMGGPPAVLYMIHAAPDKLAYFATIQFYFAITSTYSTVLRVINGIVTWEVLGYFGIAVIGWTIGNFLGEKVFDRMNGDALKRVIYFGMCISGVLMVVQNMH